MNYNSFRNIYFSIIYFNILNYKNKVIISYEITHFKEKNNNNNNILQIKNIIDNKFCILLKRLLSCINPEIKICNTLIII